MSERIEIIFAIFVIIFILSGCFFMIWNMFDFNKKQTKARSDLKKIINDCDNMIKKYTENK